MVMGDTWVSYAIFYWVLAILMFASGFVVAWVLAKGIKVPWYSWLLGSLGVLALIATAQVGVTTFLERAPFAFWPAMITFGLPGLLMIGIAYQLSYRRNRSAVKTQYLDQRGLTPPLVFVSLIDTENILRTLRKVLSIVSVVLVVKILGGSLWINVEVSRAMVKADVFKNENQKQWEKIDTKFQHAVTEVQGIKWHYVIINPLGAKTALFLHGMPECW